MKVTPVAPVTGKQQNPPRQRRAMMTIHHGEHTVIDSVTGERHTGKTPVEAWVKYGQINILT